MNLSHIMQKILIENGITKIFGIVGREASAILFDEVEFILTRHEFSAGVIAASVSRFTRSPQLCFATLGPGSTNLVTALATAHLDRLPVIAIAAQLESSSITYNEAHQCVDAVSILKPVTKYATEIRTANQIYQALSEALTTSMAYPFGPSFISIPIDLFSTEMGNYTPHLQANRGDFRSSGNFEHALSNIAQLLNESTTPLIVAGDAVIKDIHGATAVRELAEFINVPVVTTYSAKGILPPEHKLNFGVINSYADVILEYPVKQTLFGPPDLIFLIGYDIAEHHPFTWNIGNTKKIIALSSYESSLMKVVKPQPLVNAIGEIRVGVDYLIKLNLARKQTLHNINDIREKIQSSKQNMQTYDGILPTQVLSVLEKHYEDFILANDIGMHRHVMALFFEPKQSLDFLTSAGLSSFGTGLPLGIGAKLANPDRNVVVMCGDGGFHSNSGELETAARLGLKFTIILLNNNSNGLIERYQLTGTERRVNSSAVNYIPVNFALLAKANGCQGISINTLGELQPALIAADKHDGPTLIEIPVYYPELYINPYSTSWRPTKRS